jgi:hypothetical protein
MALILVPRAAIDGEKPLYTARHIPHEILASAPAAALVTGGPESMGCHRGNIRCTEINQEGLPVAQEILGMVRRQTGLPVSAERGTQSVSGGSASRPGSNRSPRVPLQGRSGLVRRRRLLSSVRCGG